MTLPPIEKRCHHTSFEKKCRQLVCDGVCDRWSSLPGVNKDTGKSDHMFGCLDDLTLYMQIETYRQADGAHSAVTQVRELAVNPEYLKRERIRAASAPLALEDRTQ